MRRLILASASPRRRQLLDSAGLTFDVQPARGVDESWRTGESAVAYTRRLAAAKTEAAVDELGPAAAGTILIAADTTVWLPRPDMPPLGKPTGRAQAEEMLRLLTAGEAHHVTTAFTLWTQSGGASTAHETTAVWMRPLKTTELEAYLDTDDWEDKAGGYAVQGRAASFVTRIEGSYTNIVGLPLAQVLEALTARDGGP
ncbi:MAG: Maf family protein [Nannocystaceae bacterium]